MRLSALLALPLLLACEGEKPKPAASSSKATASEAAPPAPSRPTALPTLQVTEHEIKVGFETVLMDKPDSPERLKAALADFGPLMGGKELTVVVERKARVPWLQALLRELAGHGATGFLVKTETRGDLKNELRLTLPSAAKSPPACAVVTMILADRAAATWKVGGGTAVKSPKGLAGPDLSMAQEELTRVGKACKDSDVLYFSGAEGVEWGLVYDLASAGSVLEKHRFARFVLLPKVPVAGRPVEVGE